jgi:serine/threonine protein kinase
VLITHLLSPSSNGILLEGDAGILGSNIDASSPSPFQMIISPEGHLILIDFGTAKDLVEKDFNGPEFVGTPDFMPPEAVKGTDEILKAGGADHTADLWALGCVIYQLLIGDPPFSAQSPYLSFLK